MTFGVSLLVSELLQKAIPEGQPLTPEENAEVMAFNLGEYLPEAKGSWRGYFGPRISWINEDGSKVEIPGRDQVTPDMVEW